jgi:hypothetical protein
VAWDRTSICCTGCNPPPCPHGSESPSFTVDPDPFQSQALDTLIMWSILMQVPAGPFGRVFPSNHVHTKQDIFTETVDITMCCPRCGATLFTSAGSGRRKRLRVLKAIRMIRESNDSLECVLADWLDLGFQNQPVISLAGSTFPRHLTSINAVYRNIISDNIPRVCLISVRTGAANLVQPRLSDCHSPGRLSCKTTTRIENP